MLLNTQISHFSPAVSFCKPVSGQLISGTSRLSQFATNFLEFGKYLISKHSSDSSNTCLSIHGFDLFLSVFLSQCGRHCSLPSIHIYSKGLLYAAIKFIPCFSGRTGKTSPSPSRPPARRQSWWSPLTSSPPPRERLHMSSSRSRATPPPRWNGSR